MTVYVPSLTGSLQDALRTIAQLAAGRSNATGTVTLTPSATSTTVMDGNCAERSTVLLSPVTANAAVALATSYIPVATTANGSFTITHSSAASVDRTFRYAIVG